MIEVFKTTVSNRVQSEKIISILEESLAHAMVTFDLEDCDKVLRIEADKIDVVLVYKTLADHGFRAEPL